MAAEAKKHACVIVLGDFGRSPRMQFHALSLAKNNFLVDVLCYGGSTPYEEVMTDQNIKQHVLKEPPKFAKYIPRFFMYILKVLWEFVVLMNMLVSLQKPSYILVQNPPAVSTLPVVWLYCYLYNIKWIIDWHNYGYTILSLSLGPNHALVKIYYWVEHFLGEKASYNFCVSEAMKNDLRENWNIEATVLYDRPPPMFRPVSLEEKHSLLLKLGDQYPTLKPRTRNEVVDETKFTQTVNGTIVEKENRPILLVSSTSWTEDEDFNVLLEAFEEYESMVIRNNNLPAIVCIITGKGPLKSYYLQQISEKHFCHISIVTPWLAAEDYPKLLGCADLGVCLHTSSSGFDLPMKVVDMFGCELPVCAIKYKCLDELVKHGINGLVFENSKDLSSQLEELLQLPKENSQLKTFRQNLKCYREMRWDKSWDNIALKIFK